MVNEIAEQILRVGPIMAADFALGVSDKELAASADVAFRLRVDAIDDDLQRRIDRARALRAARYVLLAAQQHDLVSLVPKIVAAAAIHTSTRIGASRTGPSVDWHLEDTTASLRAIGATPDMVQAAVAALPEPPSLRLLLWLSEFTDQPAP